MRILNWNIEWMNKWFSGNSDPQWKGPASFRAASREAAQRVANVITTIDPDLICLQEGPSAQEEMALFIRDFLSDGQGNPLYTGLIGKDGGAQKLYGLRKVGGLVTHMDYALDEATIELEESWDADVDGDLMLSPYDFTRQPLVLEVDGTGIQPFTIVNLHTKSKHVHGGQQAFNDPARRQEFVAAAIKARRRISAEGYRLRRYLDRKLQADNNARIVVTGDFNDGPGHDFFERSFLTHNVADIVLGSTFYPRLIFNHPLIERVEPPLLFTARFDDFVDGVMDRPLLLDH
uniref:endonuclease/exonuclease/phosphatase family protein n=1 Tax=Erythrobacter sp. TaxID=1042 RepID=UPI00261F435B